MAAFAKVLAARELARFFAPMGDWYGPRKEARMDEIADRVARDRTNAARERTSTHEAQRLSH
jgi:hypothetical protein